MAQRINPSALRGARSYVPGMRGSGDHLTQPVEFSLGSPAASDDDIIDASIDADAVAGTEEAQAWTSDAYYGRTLILTISADPGAASSVIDVYGEDYLGQGMVERFTTANGSTAIQYGKKAFYRVTKTKIVTAATNAVTAKLGTGFAVGLPFRSTRLGWAKENGIYVPVYDHDFELWTHMSDADVTAGASAGFLAPCPGFIKSLKGIPMSGGSTTDAATTVEIATVAVTGLTITLDQNTQTPLTDTPTVPGYNANNRFRPGTLLEIVHAATTAGGACSFGLEITPTHLFPPVDTDPATAITGDPRGTYESMTTLAGFEIVVGLYTDPGVNAAGNGGLHGIRHYHP